MQITLSQAQSEVLETLVKQGQYPSLEEAINTALLLLIDDVALPDADRSPEYLVWVQATRKKIDMAREQAQNGEVLEANVVLAQLRAKVQSAKEAAVWNVWLLRLMRVEIYHKFMIIFYSKV